MPKRYQGNSGRFSWVEPPARPPEGQGRPPYQTPPPPRQPQTPPQQPLPHRPPPVPQGLQLLPKMLGELETEDLILMLLCWLLYRESGDSDWLIVLGSLILG